MKKVITAINNYKLNEELKKENKFEVIGKDIQYKEAILEMLYKNINIDIIIINEKIPGEISLFNLIKKIKDINKKIKIIIILENEDIEKEKNLNKLNIYDIYYNNKINLNELIKIINKKEINMEEEIIKLKKIIEEKEKINNNINKNINNKIKNNIINNNKINNKKTIKRINIKNFLTKNISKTKVEDLYKKTNKNNKTIIISGAKNVGKSTFAILLSIYLSRQNKKVMLIDFCFNKPNLNSFFFLKKMKKTYSIEKDKINNNKNIENIYENKKELINYLKKIEIKINKNFKILFIKDLFIKNKIINIEKNKNILINNLIYLYKNKFDYLIIDFNYNNNSEIIKNIFYNSDRNIIVSGGSLLDIKILKGIIDRYKNKYNVPYKNLYIIENKATKNNINENLIKETLEIKNKILKINYNEKYKNIKNKKIDINKIIINKNLNKKLNKVI